MIETTEAIKLVLENIFALSTERISIFEALGRTIAEPVTSRRNLPPHDNSAMDGYAFKVDDVSVAPTTLKVKGVIAAGDDVTNLTVESGSCYRIMTGAFVPSGADTVIQHEWTNNDMQNVAINETVKKGFCIRKQGEDLKIGDVIDRVGEKVTAYHIARFASAGVFYISVYRRVKVAVISTGDEIADPSVQDDINKVFDANGPMLKAFFDTHGADTSYIGVIKDDKQALLDTFKSLSMYDVIVTSAGISVGDFDYMNEVAGELGITWKFDVINQKPGKHMSYGTMGNTHVFACPGNPVSAMFCSYYYIKPAIYKLSGAKQYENVAMTAKLATKIVKKKDRVEFNRFNVVSENGVLMAYPYNSQDSHIIESLVSSNAFGRLTNEMVGELQVGTEIEIYMYNDIKSSL